MSWDDALRAITLAPAEIFGVADRVGSLKAGTEANVVIWSGDPFEFSTRAEQVFVRGKKIDDAVAAGHAGEAVQDASAEVRYALRSLEFESKRPARCHAPAVFHLLMREF